MSTDETISVHSIGYGSDSVMWHNESTDSDIYAQRIACSGAHTYVHSNSPDVYRSE